MVKPTIKTAIFLLGLFTFTGSSAKAFTANVKVGDRMYAYGRAEVPDGDESGKPSKGKKHGSKKQQQMVLYSQLGPGKIMSVNADGSIVFRSDKKVTETFKGYRRYDLKPLVNCGNGKDEAMYSKQTYINDRGENRPVGHVTLKEVFGTCEFCDALIVAKAKDAPLKVAYRSLLKKVKCDFQKTKVFSNERIAKAQNNSGAQPTVGAGMAKEVYGDCASGIVVFRADRNVDADIIVSAASIMKSSNSAPGKTVATRPATAASAVRR